MYARLLKFGDFLYEMGGIRVERRGRKLVWLLRMF